MTNRPTQDLLSVRARTDVGTRSWFLRAGRGVRGTFRDVAAANRLMGEVRTGPGRLY